MAKTKNTFTDKKNEELTALLFEKREELKKLRFGGSGAKGKEANTARNIKKDIARILTEQTARKKASAA